MQLSLVLVCKMYLEELIKHYKSIKGDGRILNRVKIQIYSENLINWLQSEKTEFEQIFLNIIKWSKQLFSNPNTQCF